MGFTPEFRQYVEEKLSAVKPIQTKPMFGGVGIYAESLFFALIAEDKLYFKANDTNKSDFEARGMDQFYPYDSPTPMHYWELPADVLNNPEELEVWMDKSLAVATAAKAKKRK